MLHESLSHFVCAARLKRALEVVCSQPMLATPRGTISWVGFAVLLLGRCPTAQLLQVCGRLSLFQVYSRLGSLRSMSPSCTHVSQLKHLVCKMVASIHLWSFDHSALSLCRIQVFDQGMARMSGLPMAIGLRAISYQQ